MKSACVLALAIVASVAPAASADPRIEAKKHIDAAMALHAQEKWEQALVELSLAYSLDPQPPLLYAIGQLHVQLGHCDQAVDFYQRFLATNPGGRAATEAQQAIDSCSRHATLEPLGPDEPPPPPPTPVATPQPPAPPPPAPRLVQRAFYTDALGDTLVIAGLACGAAVAFEYLGARSERDSADRQTTYDAYSAKLESAQSKQTLALGLGIAGGALVVGGIVRYIAHDRSEPEAALAIVPTRRGGAITWSARF
jgi:tetratricopeptide (TPR) repeat protein